MKKFLTVLALTSFAVVPALARSYYEAPNAGNMNFYPLMQHQMEKEETLDFANNPDEYKEKREAKDTAIIDGQKYNSNFDANYKPASYVNTRRTPMVFVKDENGNITIRRAP